MPVADFIRRGGRVLHKASDVPLPKMRASHKRKGAWKRSAGMRQAEAEADAERGNGIIGLYNLSEYFVERSPAFKPLKPPLFERHQRRFDRVVPPGAAEPQVDLAVAPEGLRAPRKR